MDKLSKDNPCGFNIEFECDDCPFFLTGHPACQDCDPIVIIEDDACGTSVLPKYLQ